MLSQNHVRESGRMHEKSASKTRRKVNPQRPGLLLPVSLMFSLCVVSDGSAASANVDAYPHKSIRFIVPFSPGGGNDVVARLIGAKLSERWGQQVIVDNRPGAGGNIAAEIVARSNPDGYTVFLFNSATAIAPSIYSKLGYDPLKDFEPVILIATSPFALVVHPSIVAQSVAVFLGILPPLVLPFTPDNSISSPPHFFLWI